MQVLRLSSLHHLCSDPGSLPKLSHPKHREHMFPVFSLPLAATEADFAVF